VNTSNFGKISIFFKIFILIVVTAFYSVYYLLEHLVPNTYILVVSNIGSQFYFKLLVSLIKTSDIVSVILPLLVVFLLLVNSRLIKSHIGTLKYLFLMFSIFAVISFFSVSNKFRSDVQSYNDLYKIIFNKNIQKYSFSKDNLGEFIFKNSIRYDTNESAETLKDYYTNYFKEKGFSYPNYDPIEYDGLSKVYRGSINLSGGQSGGFQINIPALEGKKTVLVNEM